MENLTAYNEIELSARALQERGAKFYIYTKGRMFEMTFELYRLWRLKIELGSAADGDTVAAMIGGEWFVHRKAGAN